jgi:hypothetical protein
MDGLSVPMVGLVSLSHQGGACCGLARGNDEPGADRHGSRFQPSDGTWKKSEDSELGSAAPRILQ